MNAFFEPHFAAEAEILRSQRNETTKLEAERSALIAELEATLSPEVAVQVHEVMQRSASRDQPVKYQATDERTRSEGAFDPVQPRDA